jgi:hypothetical protein
MRPNGDGFVIPPAFKDRLDQFDKNNDGRLSNEEIEAMPVIPRERLKDALRKMGLDHDEPKKP